MDKVVPCPVSSLVSKRSRCIIIIRLSFNLLLTERDGRTGEYWPEVVAVRTERQYSPIRSRASEVSKLFIIWDRFFERSDRLRVVNVRNLRLPSANFER